MFVDVFGDSPQVKVLDFLTDHMDYDYTMTDIADGAGIARPTLYKIFGDLLEAELVISTRKVGVAHLYKLNTENPIVKALVKFDFELSKLMVKKAAEQVEEAAATAATVDKKAKANVT